MTARRPRVRRGYLPTESEAAFQMKVIQLAGFCGWSAYHPPDNRPSGNTGRVQKVAPGWPDLVLWRPPEIMVAELKTEKGKVRPDQRIVLDQLAACGIEVHVWRPSDWAEIEARISRHHVPREGDDRALGTH